MPTYAVVGEFGGHPELALKNCGGVSKGLLQSINKSIKNRVEIKAVIQEKWDKNNNVKGLCGTCQPGFELYCLVMGGLLNINLMM